MADILKFKTKGYGYRYTAKYSCINCDYMVTLPFPDGLNTICPHCSRDGNEYTLKLVNHSIQQTPPTRL